MIARIAEHGHLPADLDPDAVARAHAIIAEQPGFCGGYDLVDLATGRVLSLTMWESHDALATAENAERDPCAVDAGRTSRRSHPSIRLVDVTAVF